MLPENTVAVWGCNMYIKAVVAFGRHKWDCEVTGSKPPINTRFGWLLVSTMNTITTESPWAKPPKALAVPWPSIKFNLFYLELYTVCMFSLCQRGFSPFLPHSKNMHVWWFGDYKLSVGVCARVNGSVFVWFTMRPCDELETSPCRDRSHQIPVTLSAGGRRMEGTFHILNKLFSRLQPFWDTCFPVSWRC